MSVRSQNPVDPYPLSSHAQRPRVANGASRSSRSTRQDQAELLMQPDYDNYLSYPPVAPEVPRGPPVSYREPNGEESTGQQLARSFSQRAKGQMFAQETLEDDEYWDDHDTTPPQFHEPEQASLSMGRNHANPSSQNGLQIADRERTIQRGFSQRQPVVQSQDGPRSTPNGSRTHPHPVRQPGYAAPLKLDLSSPTTQINTVRGSKTFSEERHQKWAPDRSPLQTLEVKLNDISKEEKRARVEEAEMLLRESKTGGGARQSRRKAPAASTRRTFTRETALEPKVVENNELNPNPSSTRREIVQVKGHGVSSQKSDTRLSPEQVRQGFDESEHSSPERAVADQVLSHSDQPDSRQHTSRHDGRTAPAHSGLRAASSGQRRQNTFQGPMNADQLHPAHSPRLIYTASRTSDNSGLHAVERGRRPQNEASLATSSRKAPLAQSIPSNITRAVSLQKHQPQPLFSDDQEISRSGPMRESNSSHKAALAESTAAIGVGAPTSSKKLQKPPPTNINRHSSSEEKKPGTMYSGATQVPASADPPRLNTSTNTEDTKVEFYYKGMPKQVDLQRSDSQQASDPARRSLKEPAISGQNDNADRPRRMNVSFKVPFDRAHPVSEWKQAGTARLTVTDLALDMTSEADQAWWETSGSSSRRKSKGSSRNVQVPDAYSKQEVTKNSGFKPPLYLKCGPLLRYTGISRDRKEPQPGQSNSVTVQETWRGSVMIVTQDSQSSYEEVPTLRLFSQPRDLLPPPPDQVQDDDLAPEYVDPIAGLTKVSRRGQTLFVKPVDHLEEGKDLSAIEDDNGLFETSPSPPDNNLDGSAIPNKRTRGRDGDSLGRYKEVKGCRLHADMERDVTFWRFNIEVELSDQQAHIAYRINHGPPVGFWVPAKGQTMNVMFHSCNGFSLSVNADHFGGPDPLWRDVLNTHQTRPFHVMIGGGNQLYNDRVMVDTHHFAAWTHLRNSQEKHYAPFTDEMCTELESFYLNRYAMWFSQGLFGFVNSQIPMVNIYDDHDIIDGFGSYPDEFQRAPVFMGVGNIAFKYYMLFQHQSVPEETQADEPSWLLGARPGPYIQQRSRSVFLNLGKSIAFLGLDCRTERERYSVLTDDTYELVLDRCRREIEEGETKHLLVLLSVPIAYPRLAWLENILTSRAMGPVKALGRAGFLRSSFMNKFDSGIDVLDDLDDHWTAIGHKEERANLVQDLQELAAEKSIRITILGGDVHLGAVGQFYSNPKLKIPKDRDHRYMPNVISSAIVDTPTPEMLADTLNKRNKVHRFDPYTMEDMIPIFTHDVDGKKRNNKRLLPRRNWCSIREYHPGSTPPPTPPESLTPTDQMSESEDHRPQTRRRFSFSLEDANPRKLIRRLSQRAPPSSYRDDMIVGSPVAARCASHDGYFPPVQQPQTAPPTRTSFPINSNSLPQPQTAPPYRATFTSTTSYNQRASIDAIPSAPHPRPGIFRRPTNLSENAAKKGGAPPFSTDSQGNLIEDLNDHIDLEDGLDVTLNCEVNQGDPAGITTPYRLLVPALRYDGSSDRQKLDSPLASGGDGGVGGVQRRPTLLNKLGFGRIGNRSVADRQGEGNWGQASETESDSLGGEGQYSVEDDDDDQYYGRENRPSGGLKRWFSGRKNRRQQEGYLPDGAQRGGTQAQDEIAGRELQTTPQQNQPPPQQQQAARSPSKGGNGHGYDALPPIEPFPTQARGKAARVMGIDHGPSYPQSALLPPGRQQQNGTKTSSASAGPRLNQTQPLPPQPPTSQGAGAAAEEEDEAGSRFYATYGYGQTASAPRNQGQTQPLRGGATAAGGTGPVVHGYSGVEAYPGRKSRGGKLRKWV